MIYLKAFQITIELSKKQQSQLHFKAWNDTLESPIMCMVADKTYLKHGEKAMHHNKFYFKVKTIYHPKWQVTSDLSEICQVVRSCLT